MPRPVVVVLRLLALVLPVAGAMVLLMQSFGTATEPQRAEGGQQRARPARVLTLEPLPFAATATGYGTVRPARSFRATARVEGTVAWMDARLQDGETVPADTVLLRLDETDIRLALAQIDADLATLDIRRSTFETTLALEQREQTLAEAEADRNRALFDRGSIAQAALDQAERGLLAAQARVQAARNAIAINDAERAALLARRAIAERDLTHTAISVPFALRVGEVGVEVGQYVPRGAALFEGDGTEAAEVVAEFPIGRLRPLVLAQAGPFGLTATVRLRTPERVIEWPATVDRVAQEVGARSQSAGVIVRVEQPPHEPGTRPPLRQGMFVEVTLQAPPVTVQGVVPATAVHDGQLYVLDGEDRLRLRPVTPLARQGDLVLLGEGWQAGTRVVVSDLIPAVAGMRLMPQPDAELARRLAAQAAGAEAVQ